MWGMASDSEASPFANLAIIAIAAVALYFVAFFPALSWEVRHSRTSGILNAWRPLPSLVTQRMFSLWIKIDPRGADRLLTGVGASD